MRALNVFPTCTFDYMEEGIHICTRSMFLCMCLSERVTVCAYTCNTFQIIRNNRSLRNKISKNQIIIEAIATTQHQKKTPALTLCSIHFVSNRIDPAGIRFPSTIQRIGMCVQWI